MIDLLLLAVMWVGSMVCAFWWGKREGREDERHRALMAEIHATFLAEMDGVS